MKTMMWLVAALSVAPAAHADRFADVEADWISPEGQGPTFDGDLIDDALVETLHPGALGWDYCIDLDFLQIDDCVRVEVDDASAWVGVGSDLAEIVIVADECDGVTCSTTGYLVNAVTTANSVDVGDGFTLYDMNTWVATETTEQLFSGGSQQVLRLEHLGQGEVSVEIGTWGWFVFGHLEDADGVVVESYSSGVIRDASAPQTTEQCYADADVAQSASEKAWSLGGAALGGVTSGSGLVLGGSIATAGTGLSGGWGAPAAIKAGAAVAGVGVALGGTVFAVMDTLGEKMASASAAEDRRDCINGDPEESAEGDEEEGAGLGGGPVGRGGDETCDEAEFSCEDYMLTVTSDDGSECDQVEMGCAEAEDCECECEEIGRTPC